MNHWQIIIEWMKRLHESTLPVSEWTEWMNYRIIEQMTDKMNEPLNECMNDLCISVCRKLHVLLCVCRIKPESCRSEPWPTSTQTLLSRVSHTHTHTRWDQHCIYCLYWDQHYFYCLSIRDTLIMECVCVCTQVCTHWGSTAPPPYTLLFMTSPRRWDSV